MEPSFHLTRQPRTWWHTGCVMYEHARVHEHYLYINVNAPPHPTNPPEPHFCGTVRDPSAPGGICHELSIQKIRYFSDAKKKQGFNSTWFYHLYQTPGCGMLWVCLTMAHHPRNSLWTTPYVVDDVDGAARKTWALTMRQNMRSWCIYQRGRFWWTG